MGDRLSQDAANIRGSGNLDPDEYQLEAYYGPGNGEGSPNLELVATEGLGDA